MAGRKVTGRALGCLGSQTGGDGRVGSGLEGHIADSQPQVLVVE